MPFSPVIVAFCNDRNQGYIGSIVQNIRDNGYMCMVDTINGQDREWFMKNYDCPNMTFVFECDRISSLEAKYIQNVCPDLIIYFNQDVELPDDYWRYVRNWINNDIHPEIEAGMLDFDIEDYMIKTSVAEPVPYEVEMTANDHVEEKEYFEFRCELEGDVMIYEVWKPFVTVPYCTVERQFSKNGHYTFFTSLLFDTTFRIGVSDRRFLVDCWKKLGMENEIDLEMLDKMYMKRVADCFAGEPEPEVWRVGLEVVKSYIMSGHEHKVKPVVECLSEKEVQEYKSWPFIWQK